MSYKVQKINNLRTIKALRGQALTIDLQRTYTGMVLSAWMKKDPDADLYRSFEIIDNRFLFLSKAKTQDYYDEASPNTIVEEIEGRWYFDVRMTPVGSTDPNDEQVIVTGTILFADNVTDSGGQELVSNARPYANEFIQLIDTPSLYDGFGDLFVKVNSTEDGLTFEALSSSDITQFESDITITTSQISDFAQTQNYIHNQVSAASTWTVTHNLAKLASVTVVDSGENVVVGEVTYIDLNTIRIDFTASFSGRAYFN